MAGFLDGMAAVLLPKGKGSRGGVSAAPGYNPTREIMTLPTYRQHLTDLYATRTGSDSRTLLNELVNQDPDVSAAMHSYLTISASADLVFYAFGADGELDGEGTKLAHRLMELLTVTNDYTLGFSSKPTMGALVTDLRYMQMLRGSIGAEIILDKTYTPSELRLVDTASLVWHQKTSGAYFPQQKVAGLPKPIDLNVPTFFTSNFHQNPTDAYTYSPFVAAINTIAARTEVINELYKIMQVVGFPRLDVSVLEEVLLANAPPAFRTDPKAMRDLVSKELVKIQSTLAGTRADQPFVHSSAVTATILNDKNPSAGLQIQGVIDVLDGQNQAALKVMPAVVGKSSNATTASTEARLFAMSADSLNRSVAALLSKVLTFGCRLSGYQGRIEARFRPVEMRPVLELEPHLTMKGARLRTELSLGTITDAEYHMELFGRPAPDGAPELSGTNFLAPSAAASSVDTQDVSPNQDSLGRGLTAPDSKSAKSNATKTGTPKAK